MRPNPWLLLFVPLTLLGCSDSPAPNRPPKAKIAAAPEVLTGQPVQLDGSSSRDPEGARLAFYWYFTQAPSASMAELNDPSLANPSFTPDAAGTYEIALRVFDGRFWSNAALVQVNSKMSNRAPQASAAAPAVIRRGGIVALDGAKSTDPDGDKLVYLWEIVGLPSGSGARLSSVDGAATTFTADLIGVYQVRLIVSDGKIESAPLDIDIVSYEGNAPPVAVLGPSVFTGTTASVVFDASRSYDLNGDALSYVWALVAKPVGSLALLSSTAGASTTLTPDIAGTYQVGLTAVDIHGAASLQATQLVTVQPADRRPVAVATSVERVFKGDSAVFDGSLSSDADNDVLSYHWELIALPPGSAVMLNAPGAVNPSFRTDVAGTYVVRLSVDDGVLYSAPVTAWITALEPNTFQRVAFNPVLTGTAIDGNWASGPSVLYDSAATSGARFKLWYTGRAAGKPAIFYAQSATGAGWEGKTVVLQANGGTTTNGVESPTVLYDAAAGKYKMWFSGLNNANPRIYTIQYSESTDGIVWTAAQKVIDNIGGGCTDGFGDMDVSVILEKGVYKAWFTGMRNGTLPSNAQAEICFAESWDGKIWFGAQRVVRRGRWSNVMDSDHVYAPAVVYENGLYRMWYAGDDTANQTIGYADSTDGITWNTYNSVNPVFFPSSNLDVNGLQDPFYLRVGTEVYLWYAGNDNTGQWNILLTRP